MRRSPLPSAGKHVYLVEREPCIGGQMAKFDKTFPTLDCAACILTPKMVQVGQHPNIDLLSFSEVEQVSGYVGNFRVKVRRKARYINEDACTGCNLCVENCTWDGILSEFDYGLGTRPVAYKSFPQAVPAVPVIDRAGTSRCTFACPAGVKAHGYVSLVRKGEYEKAFGLVLDATPLVGSLGRACYAQCEAECTRAGLEGPLPIRRLKRFIADNHYGRGAPAGIEPTPPNGKRVAVVGSGPAGLTAAWQLARKGYRVKIFEAADRAGGMLTLAIPDYRLPAAVVEQDIGNVTALGVEIATSTRVDDLEGLRRDGYDAVLVATGAPVSTRLGVPGEDLDGVVSGLEFLEAAKGGDAAGLGGKRAVIVGGGNVAMDAARTARRLAGEPEGPGEPEEIVVTDAARTAWRLGAPEVIVAYRRGRGEMPAYPEEVDAAEQEGTAFSFQVAPVEVLGDEQGRVRGLRCVRTELGAPDASGRRRPEPVPGSEFVIDCEVVIAATGLRPEDGVRLPAGDGRERDDPGRPGNAADRCPVRLRRRRCRVGRAGHRARGRSRAAGRLHDRPLAARCGAGSGELRRQSCPVVEPGRRAGQAASGARPPGPAGAGHPLRRRPGRFRGTRTAADRGGGPVRRRAVPRLRPLLRMRAVHRGLRGRRDRPDDA